MGTYVHILNRRLTKNRVQFGDPVVSVDAAPYSHKPSMYSELDQKYEKRMERAFNTPDHLQSDYIVFSHTMDGAPVYRNNRNGIWSDGSGHWTGIDPKTDHVGTLYKIGRHWHIVPEYQPIENYMAVHCQKHYNRPLKTGWLHVIMDETYTATVRDIQSFKHYLKTGNVDPTQLRLDGAGSEDTPSWFIDTVNRHIEAVKQTAKQAQLRSQRFQKTFGYRL